MTGRERSDLARPGSAGEPPADCGLCPRLSAFRGQLRAAHADWFNAPVPSFGDAKARLLVVGLAPGLKGANRTGRPFTGDHAGELLYATLAAYGFAEGAYEASREDGLSLRDCLITNAVRCVPPANKPTGVEAMTCLPFLRARIAALPNLAAILALGRVAHDSAVRALGARPAGFPFAHGRRHAIAGLALWDSFHCSRYNTNTGRLTASMFAALMGAIRREIGG